MNGTRPARSIATRRMGAHLLYSSGSRDWSAFKRSSISCRSRSSFAGSLPERDQKAVIRLINSLVGVGAAKQRSARAG
jgi:hypothetical protein